MSRRQAKASYWQDAPIPREQLVLIPQALEELIPMDHPVRLVDEVLNGLNWTDWEAKYHQRNFGQPPIHPSVLAKVLLFAMIRRIRSSRQIEYELKHSIDFMWLTSGRRIDHTTISEFRRKSSKELRGIFKQMIKLAMDLGLANLAELCIDGTRILGNSNRYKTWTTTRLAKALEQLDEQIAEALENLEVNDSLEEDLLGENVSDRLPAAIANLKERREQLAAAMETTKSMDNTRQVNGYEGPAQLPKTDMDSRILPNKEGGYAANYTPMATTETVSGLIVDVDVVIGNVEHNQLIATVDRIESDYAVDVEVAIADSAYITGENLTACEARQVELIGPLAETNRDDNPAERSDLTQPVAQADIERLPIYPQTKRFDKAAFIYDPETDCYYCPAGKPLVHRTTEHAIHHRNRKPIVKNVFTCHQCEGCPLAALCRKNPQSPRGREVMDDEHEGARRRHRERMKTEKATVAYSRRQNIAETPFAAIKNSFGMRRFLLRGIEGVGLEWRWAALAFNTKKILKRWSALRAVMSLNFTGTIS